VLVQEQRQAVGITEGLGAHDRHQKDKQYRQLHFPPDLIEKGLKVACATAEATEKEDEIRILSQVGEKTRLLDETVHGMMAASVLRRVLQEGDSAKWRRYLKAIQTGHLSRIELDLVDCKVELGRESARPPPKAASPLQRVATRPQTDLLEQKLFEIFEALDPSCLVNMHISGVAIPCDRWWDRLLGFDKLTALDLNSSIGLTRLPGISALQQLKVLNLEHCVKLETLPEEICLLHSLVTLNLGMCTGLKSLPEELGRLQMLEQLILCLCDSLHDLPGSILQNPLQLLDLRLCPAGSRVPTITEQLKRNGTEIWELDGDLQEARISVVEDKGTKRISDILNDMTERVRILTV